MKDKSKYDRVFDIDMKPISNSERLFELYMSATSFEELFLNKEKKKHEEIVFVNDVKPKSLDSTGIMPILFVPDSLEEDKKDMEDFIELKDFIKSSSKSGIKSKVYEWVKGVIGIDIDGLVIKNSLDNTDINYAVSTKEVINKIDKIKINSENLFQVGVIGSNNGLIIFQSNKEDALVYLPLEITKKQFDSLQGIIVPRGGFNYSFVHNNSIFENKSANELLNYANNLVVSSKRWKKF